MPSLRDLIGDRFISGFGVAMEGTGRNGHHSHPASMSRNWVWLLAFESFHFIQNINNLEGILSVTEEKQKDQVPGRKSIWRGGQGGQEMSVAGI